MRLLFLLFFFPLSLFAQDNIPKSVSHGLNYLGGKMIVHTPKINITAPPYSQAIEYSYCKQTKGNRAWQQRYGFPEIGINIAAADFGDQKLGRAIGLYPSIQFRLINSKQSHWYFKLGGGIGLINKSWNRTPSEDTVNNIIGSTVNNFTMIQSGYRMNLNKRWSMQAGIHFYHISNAAARHPNYGINTIGGFLGLRYHPFGIADDIKKRPLKTEKNPLNLVLKYCIAFAEARTPDGPLYPYYHVTLAGSKLYNNKNRAMLGLDATYSAELYTTFKNNYKFIGTERQNAIRYSIFGAHEFVFGKVGLPLQIGAYLNRPNGGGRFYQKLGMNYHFYHNDNNRLKDAFLITQLFTELVNAQYAEIGFGIML